MYGGWIHELETEKQVFDMFDIRLIKKCEKNGDLLSPNSHLHSLSIALLNGNGNFLLAFYSTTP